MAIGRTTIAAASILAAAGAPRASPAMLHPPAFEAAIQFALERLESGRIALSREVGQEVAMVRPERTWKSVSGHWCREFAIWIEVEGERTTEHNGIRCRDEAGVWQPVPGTEPD